MNVAVEEAYINVEDGKASLYISDELLDSMLNKRKEELDGRTYIKGIDVQKAWNLCDWFIETVGALLEYLLNHHVGYPACLTPDKWNDILRKMVECIKLMDEDRAREYLGISSYDCDQRIANLVIENKNRFFELFSEWFFNLWD